MPQPSSPGMLSCLLTRVPFFALVACAGCGWLGRNDNAEGVRLYQQGNYLGAVNHFQQALAQQPGSPDCFYNLGATYHQQAKLFGRPADMQTAEQYYHLCLSRNPNHDACQRALAVLLVEENRGGEAVAQLQSWAQRQPTNPNPQIELARLSQEHGDLRQAENHLIDALAVDPSNPRALVALGQIREATGDSGQALANYSRALSVDGQQPTVAARVAALSGASQGGVVQVAGTQMAALPPGAAAGQPFVVQPAVQMVPQPVLPQPVAQVPLATGNTAR
ncbi:MAG: tetratricopeptide repeat protein [Planctomycetota bacterium]